MQKVMGSWLQVGKAFLRNMQDDTIGIPLLAWVQLNPFLEDMKTFGKATNQYL
jgi:hypothetical protein